MVVAHVSLSHEAASGAAKAARRAAPAPEDFSAAVARAERAAPGGGTGAAKDVVKEAGKDAAGGVAKLSAPRTAPSPHEDEIPKWLQKR